jgi:diguanylate cyclase
LRGGDILVRYGGEEFVVILPGVSGPTLGQVAERLLESVRHGPFFVDGNIIPLTVSGGGATFPHTAETAQELIANADKALYLSKKSGRNCYHYAE